MWLQQDIEIWKKIILKTQKWENFGSLALLARNNLWNFSSLYPFNKASYIMSVTNIGTCSIDNQLIYDFTINKLFQVEKDYDLMQKCEKFRLARSPRS